jgi:flagellar basal-body rod modification protein FlgD
MTDITGTISPTPVTPGASTYTSGSSASTSSSNAMSGQMFLQLLVKQLQMQDPSSPMDSNQMISQMSQLSSMEQLTNLNSSISTLSTTMTASLSLQMRAAAAELVGKQVAYTAADGTAKTGIASAVSYANGTPTVTVGSDTVALVAVTGVTGAPTTPAAPASTAS